MICDERNAKFWLRTETHSAEVRPIFTDIDRIHYVDHEVDDVLPVVDSSLTVFHYAAVDYEWYVQQTSCNRAQRGRISLVLRFIL